MSQVSTSLAVKVDEYNTHSVHVVSGVQVAVGALLAG